MIYLFESKVPEDKSVFFALVYVYGIGKTNSILICKKLGFSKNLKIKVLTHEQINQLIQIIETSKISLSTDLKKRKLLASKKLVSIKSYRGLRRRQGLPVRGQRTHTNSKTAKRVR